MVKSGQAGGEGGGEFYRGLGLFDATMLVMGAMIGSGIFIVPADMARRLGSPGWLLAGWVLTGLLTIAGALSYGELASMFPRAGGQYVYLREAFSPICGFGYGWTFFTVIQTGSIAAVAVAFARFLGVLWPVVSEDHYLIPPLDLSTGYAVSLSTAQLAGLVVIALLTWTNRRGLKYGKAVQNIFTIAKSSALLGLIVAGLLFGWSAAALRENFERPWAARGLEAIAPGLDASTWAGLLVALCVVQTGSLFSADSWHNITFAAGEVKDPRRNLPLSLALGSSLVILLYLLVNVAYLATLPFGAIQHAASDRVGTATLEAILPGSGSAIMALAIMISTFGCINGLILAGARAYYAMARDGLFFRPAGRLNRAKVPGAALLMQGVWAAVLVLPRVYDRSKGTYGNLYSNLLDYVISAALIFYIVTILGIFRLRRVQPHAERPYRAFGYPLIPGLYVAGAGAVLGVLFVYRPSTTWPGLAIVLLGLPAYWLFQRSAKRRAGAQDADW
jgi:APA family basic amino acid/polyamine antiporter